MASFNGAVLQHVTKNTAYLPDYEIDSAQIKHINDDTIYPQLVVSLA